MKKIKFLFNEKLRITMSPLMYLQVALYIQDIVVTCPLHSGLCTSLVTLLVPNIAALAHHIVCWLNLM